MKASVVLEIIHLMRHARLYCKKKNNNFDMKRFIRANIGYMQGRLLSDNSKRIQNFPELNWKNELFIAHKINFRLIEWTINKNNMAQNPLYNSSLIELKKLSKRFNVKINSVTCDYFMEECFFKKKKSINK